MCWFNKFIVQSNFATALLQGRNYPGDHHICGIMPFHRRNSFDNNFVFFPHGSAISNQSAVYFLKQTMLNKTGVQQIVSNTYYRRLSTIIRNKYNNNLWTILFAISIHSICCKIYESLLISRLVFRACLFVCLLL